MISNARKAELYDRAAREVRRGWTKRSLQRSDGRVCLAGAVQRVASISESREIEADLADELYRTSLYVRSLAENGRWIKAPVGSLYERSGDGGIAVVEAWNDAHWRRRSQVVGLLEQQRDVHLNLARIDRAEELEATIRGLRERVRELEARVVELETKNARLEAEVGLLRVLRAKVTVKQLLESSTELAALDAQLDTAGRELEGLYADVEPQV